MTAEQEKIIEDLRRTQSKLFESQSIKNKVFAPQGSKIEQRSNQGDAFDKQVEDVDLKKEGEAAVDGDLIEMSRNSV